MNTKIKHWSASLPENACGEAVRWASKQKSRATAWRDCERGDWMLWLIGQTNASNPYSEERKPLVRVACECARLAWKYMPQASRDALEVVEAWTRGEASAEDCRKARAAADAAAYAAAAYAADAAAYAYAAAAAYAAAYAAYTAYAAYAYAAYTAYAAAAAAAAARKSTLDKSAQIVRKYYPEAPKL